MTKRSNHPNKNFKSKVRDKYEDLLSHLFLITRNLLWFEHKTLNNNKSFAAQKYKKKINYGKQQKKNPVKKQKNSLRAFSILLELILNF